MERIYFTTHQGKKILIEDFSQMRPGPEFLALIEQAQRLIASQPQGSLLALLDASGANFNTDILGRMKDFVSANKPYVRCAAVVGVNGLLGVALSALTKASGRSFHLFADRAAALEFLAAQ
jgi:hypothetical protein